MAVGAGSFLKPLLLGRLTLSAAGVAGLVPVVPSAIDREMLGSPAGDVEFSECGSATEGALAGSRCIARSGIAWSTCRRTEGSPRSAFAIGSPEAADEDTSDPLTSLSPPPGVACLSESVSELDR